MLKIEALSKSYTAETQALDKVSFEVSQPQIVAVIGPSGAGKSTLIRCINRLVEPTSGCAILNGENVTALGSAQVPVIADYGIKETAVLLIDRSKLYSIELPEAGGWDNDGGGMFQKKNASSGQGHAAAKIAYWNMWLNWYSVFPNTSCVIYGLSS